MKSSVVVTLVLLGCGPTLNTTAFNHRFPDNRPEDLAAVLQALPAQDSPAVRNATGQPLIVATTQSEAGSERRLLALRPNGEELWSVPFDALTRPEVLGDVVVTSTREEVVALDLSDGHVLWRKSTESLAYVGASRSGRTILYVLSVGAAGGATRVGRLHAVDARTGRKRWGYDIAGVLGRPEASGGFVFVPWDRQNIAILEVATGIERARLRSTDDVIAWVRSHPSGVFYGNRGIYRLDERSASGVKTQSTYRPPPIPEAPRDPMVEDDAFFPMPGTRSARGRIRIYFEPEGVENGAIRVVGDRFYYVYYRYVFAFDSQDEVVWARMLPQDVLRADVVPRGLMTLGEGGELRLLDAETGGDIWTGGTEAPLASADLDLGAFDPGGEPTEADDLETALAQIAGDPDNRLVAARAYAVELLAQRPNPTITQLLLDLYAQRAVPGAVKEAIANALRVRTTGTEHLVAALDQHYDYLDETPVPPLDLLVPALLEQRKTEAVTGLVGHMLDHETPANVLPLVIQGIVELGDASVVPSLRDFLVLYHADSTFAEAPGALAAAAEGIFRHGGDEGRQLLQALTGDTKTIEPLGVAIRGLFERETQQAEAAARAEAEAEAAAAAEAERQARARRPNRLSQSQINEVFIAQTEALRNCVEQELERNPRLGQVRFVFIIDREGVPSEYRFAPNRPEFVGCVRPIVAALRFPPIRARRQPATFTVNLRSRSSGTQQPTEPQDRFWWSRAQRRAESAGSGEIGRPWWEVRQAPAPSEPAQPPQGAGDQNFDDVPWWMQGESRPSDSDESGNTDDAAGRSDTDSSDPGDSTGSNDADSDGDDAQPWWLPTE